MAVGIRRTDHATPLYPLNLALTSPTSSSRSVNVVRSWTKTTEYFIISINWAQPNRLLPQEEDRVQSDDVQELDNSTVICLDTCYTQFYRPYCKCIQ
jgi:hypothetical protein